MDRLGDRPYLDLAQWNTACALAMGHTKKPRWFHDPCSLTMTTVVAPEFGPGCTASRRSTNARCFGNARLAVVAGLEAATQSIPPAGTTRGADSRDDRRAACRQEQRSAPRAGASRRETRSEEDLVSCQHSTINDLR